MHESHPANIYFDDSSATTASVSYRRCSHADFVRYWLTNLRAPSCVNACRKMLNAALCTFMWAAGSCVALGSQSSVEQSGDSQACQWGTRQHQTRQ